MWEVWVREVEAREVEAREAEVREVWVQEVEVWEVEVREVEVREVWGLEAWELGLENPHILLKTHIVSPPGRHSSCARYQTSRLDISNRFLRIV